MITWEETFVTIGHSYLDDRVWVPSVPDDDMRAFEYAGGLRAVKAWVLKEQVEQWNVGGREPQVTSRDFKWVFDGDRVWSLLVRSPLRS